MRRFSSALAGILLAASAWAADPQGYTLVNPETGDDAVDAALRDSSLLISLRDKTPAPPFALIDRARGDYGRFVTVMESFGYYKSYIHITVADHDIADKTLPDLLEKVPQGQTVEVKTVIDRGPQYTLRRISVEGTLPDGLDAERILGIKSGDPAIASRVLAGQGALLTTLQEHGYAFAKVDTPSAFADDAANTLDISYAVDPGRKMRIGTISFVGLKDVNESYARDSLTIHPGDLYQPSEIEAARLQLVGLGVFSGVSVEAVKDAATDDTVPLTFDVKERRKHAVALSGSYSTDLGVSLSAKWSHRNLLGNGEQLNLAASGIGLGGTATAGIGYDLSGQFIKPRFLRDDQELEVNVAAIKQHLDAYSQTAETFGIFARKKFSTLWSGSAGLSYTHDQVSQQNLDYSYDLLALPVTAAYDSTKLKDPLADPVQGGRAAISVAPTVAFGNKTLLFAVLQASGSMYFDISGDGRSVIAARALLGSIQGGKNLDLPPDQRLYAGGSGTVRGFRYQSIGPHFANGDPMGAASVDAVSLEYRQRLWSDYGFAAFVDAGQASADSLPFNGSVEVGAGVGARYYTSIGAIRADIAVPVTKVPNGDAFEIYISIGQAF
ncbi:autotransporter assembly complex protein TamA [Rhizomicrobium electricum]|uniref:Autotransporter assembly complex family protein n=1 Tax=Rhizomicrobium electricum TaxID=480070 RepID=A0ABN1E7W4_9PROT|nr:BamA/TamA family outer membrane protein [Rhizomicrobium electricum]NIJ47830.1 translocation and assembly module TamA [Rhizomicrobium electricum]